jgi:hypothetical protein
MCVFYIKIFLVAKTSKGNILFSNFNENITHSVSDGVSIPTYLIPSNHLITLANTLSGLSFSFYHFLTNRRIIIKIQPT